MNTIFSHILKNTDVCTGCGACAAACKMNCIAMQPDFEGFLHPQVGTDNCADCGQCRRTCPMTHDPSAEINSPRETLQVFAAWHLDENIRNKSSSGGLFTALAVNILSQGGVVVGAMFDDQLIVRHAIVESPSELHRLRGSKYVQSQLTPFLYHQIKDLLWHGRPVLFSGTPCQVAGLRKYLDIHHDNLYCCDLVCHGTPSPLLWANYVEYIKMKGYNLADVSFRDKTSGWKKYGLRLYLQNGTSMHYAMFNDPYLTAYLRNYSLRPSCYSCQFTNTLRNGDLTIADFWGVAEKYPEYDLNDKGTSLVLVNSNKGMDWLKSCQKDLFLGPADLDTAIAGNSTLARPSHRPPERKTFFYDLKALQFPALLGKYRLYPPTVTKNIIGLIKVKIKRFIQKTIDQSYRCVRH